MANAVTAKGNEIRQIETDVEHFRPKAEVKEAGENHQGYWWLAYSWENLLIACKTCNQEYKRIKIPTEGREKKNPTQKIATLVRKNHS